MIFADGATSGFDVRDDLPGHVGTVDLQLGRQFFLGQASKSAKLGDMLADVIGLGLQAACPFPSREPGSNCRATTGKPTSQRHFRPVLGNRGGRLNSPVNRWSVATVVPAIIALASLKQGCHRLRDPIQRHSVPSGCNQRGLSDSNSNHCSGGDGVRSIQNACQRNVRFFIKLACFGPTKGSKLSAI